jgi:serine/threonine protein phosphatase PrpC
MGCSTSKPKQNEQNDEPLLPSTPSPKRKLRKQLTLSEDTLQGISGAAGGEKFSPPTSPGTPSKPKVKDGKTPLRRSFSCSSVTDTKGKANFSEKTAMKTDNDIKPEEFGIYVTCRKGTKHTAQPNQDSWYVRKDDGFAVYGVFDGHGKSGHDVSNFVKRHLPPLIENDERFRGPQQQAAVIEAFDKVTRMIKVAAEKKELDCERSGSTGTIVIHDQEKELLFTAHVGDSGSALARGPQQKAQYLTPDHKPNLPGETKRIRAAGGTVDFDGHQYRVYPGLNMSRAFGDLLGRTAGIISIPDINQVKLSTADRYLLVCSDGVWEWILPQQAFDICHKAMMTGGNPAKELAFAASNAWLENAEDVIDDITIIFVDLANNGKASKHEQAKKKSILKRSKTSESIGSEMTSGFGSEADPSAHSSAMGSPAKDPAKKAKGILKRSKTSDSVGSRNSEITTVSNAASVASPPLIDANSAKQGLANLAESGKASKQEVGKKAKGILKRSKTSDSVGSHATNSEITTASHISGSIAVVNSESTPGTGENGDCSKDSKADILAIQAEKVSDEAEVWESIPSSRGPERPLKMPLQLRRSNYVSSSVEIKR